MAGETRFAEAVRGELRRARVSHKPMNSLHEGYAVLLEEVEELWEEVRKRWESRTPGALLAELIQIGAMAQRMAEDCGLIGKESV